MNRFLRVAIGATTLGAALAVGGAGTPAVAESAAAAVIVQPYSADSGPRCPVGTVRGVFGWHRGPVTSRPLVDVRGVLVDPAGPDVPCADGPRYTIVTFRALEKNVEVAMQTRRVDNGTLEFAFPLASVQGIDAVAVRVCRVSWVPGPYDYCGPIQTYPAPVTTTA